MRLRLFIAFLLVVLVTALGTVFLTNWRLRQDVGQFLNRGGLSGNDQLVQDLEARYRQMHGWGEIGDWLSQHSGGTNAMQRVTLADEDGRILSVAGHMSGAGMGQGMGMQTGPNRNADQATLTPEQIAAAIPLYDGSEIIGYLLPENPMNVPAGVENNLLTRLTRSALIASGFAVLLSLLLAGLLATVLLRPIGALTRAAAAMGGGDLRQRVQPTGSEETRLLAHTFNEMAGSLQQAEDRRKALTADIAHELRNPLAIQRANLEALQDGLLPMSPEQLEPVFRQNLLLGQIVNDLRTLALADSGHLSLEKTPTDLSDLVRRKARDLEADAASLSIRIRTDLPPEPVVAHVDPGRIGQILANLLSNALRHSPQGSEVTLTLARMQTGVQITVRDRGPGIPPDDLPHIFERFYRVDKARQRSSGSTGLGLSIARHLAEAHGGTLTAANHPDGGAEFTLTLPG